MNAKRGLTILAVAFILFEGMFAFVVPVQSAGPTVTVVQSKICSNNSAATLGCSFTSNPTAGNTLVFVMGWAGLTARTFVSFTSPGGGCTDTPTSNTEVDTSQPTTPVFLQANVAYVLSTAGGAACAGAWTVTISGTTSSIFQINIYEVSISSGFTFNTVQTNSAVFSSGASGSSVIMNTASTTGNVFAFAAAEIIFNCGAPTLGAGTGWTTVLSGGEGAQSITSNTALTTTFPWSLSSAAAACGALDYGIMISGSSSSSAAQTQTIGSCPTKDVSTFTLVNSTIYFYAGTALAQSSVVSAQTFLASITGSASQTLYLAIYATPAAGGVSPSNPLTRLGYQTFTISASTKNTALNWNTAVNQIATGATWAVGVAGTNKLVLNQSTFSGVTSQTFTAGFVGGAGFFNNLGSASTNLYLCATANYQGLVTTTTTTTAAATSTTVTTSTSTVLTVGTGLLTSASNLPVIFLILLLPAGLFLGITKNLAGGLVGLLIGTVIGELMGILPIWAFTGLVVSLVALAFVVSRRGE